MKIGRVVSVIIVMIILLGVIGIISTSMTKNKEKDYEISVGTLSGPTAFGMAKLFDNDNYNITLCSAPDEMMVKVLNNDLDIAAVPTNNAALMYNKTEGRVKILAVNTLGNLYVITNRDDIKTIADLDGKSILLAGKGATPEIVLSKLTANMNVDMLFKSEHAEVISLLKAGKADIALLPEPFVTIGMENLKDYKVALNLSEVWEEENNSTLPMGCVIVSEELAKNKDIVEQVLKDYKESIEYVQNNNSDASKIIVANNVFPNEKIVEEAIPRCNITILEGKDMKKSVKDYLNIIYNFNPSMIGGSLPDEEFYY